VQFQTYRNKYPQKAVSILEIVLESFPWAILMAGGSLSNVYAHNKEFALRQRDETFLPSGKMVNNMA
jgi:hypothetical protein